MLLLVAFLSQSVSFQRGGNVVATLLAPCFSELFFGWAFTQKKTSENTNEQLLRSISAVHHWLKGCES